MEPIIDAHQHFWYYNEEDYAWMDDRMDVLKENYLPEDLLIQSSSAGVIGSVVVQARQKIEETKWLLSLAEENDFIKGVVGWVDLRSEALDEQLSEYSFNSKLVGVRHVIHDEPDPDFMLQKSFLEGIKNLQKYELSYDLLLFPEHLQNAVELVGKFPEQGFVLNHISKPYIKSGRIEPWKSGINSLASFPNVYCKISGMVTEADVVNWHYEDFLPYLDLIVESFGTDRLMLGSDWPVCRLAGEYKAIMEIPRRYFNSFSDTEKKKIFRKNCIAFYNLDGKG